MSKIEHVLPVIHYTICGAVCFKFAKIPSDDWMYTLSLIIIIIVIIIIISEVWTVTLCLWSGHKTMVCVVCIFIFSCIMAWVTAVVFPHLECLSKPQDVFISKYTDLHDWQQNTSVNDLTETSDLTPQKDQCEILFRIWFQWMLTISNDIFCELITQVCDYVAQLDSKTL